MSSAKEYKKKMKFSLVIPCYNEVKNIPLLLERCAVFNSRDDFEIILVDNGSTDDSKELLKRLLTISDF